LPAQLYLSSKSKAVKRVKGEEGTQQIFVSPCCQPIYIALCSVEDVYRLSAKGTLKANEVFLACNNHDSPLLYLS